VTACSYAAANGIFDIAAVGQQKDKDITTSKLKALMNGDKIVKKWAFHHETGLTWLEAAENCRQSGGVLAFFDDAYDHIQALKQIPMDARFWVGYSDLALEGLWKTVTNEIPSYARWIEQQPDNRLGNEDCGLIVMGPWGRGRMMDGDCESRNGIPEWNVPVGHLCRIDSNPIQLDFDVAAGVKKESDIAKTDEEEVR